MPSNILKIQCPFCQYSIRQELEDKDQTLIKEYMAKALMTHLRMKHARHDERKISVDEDKEISISTIVSMQTKEGRVDFSMGEEIAQLDIPKAKLVRDMLSEAIEAAISDSVLMVFLLQKIGMDEDKASRVLMDFRELRQGFRGSVRPN